VSQRLLSVAGLSKSFPGTLALDNVALDVSAGEVVAVLGQNGSGKSTLVKVLAGIYTPDAGADVTVYDPAGQLLSASDTGESLHFIHQDLGLVPSLSTVENLDLGRRLTRRDALPHNRKRERTDAELLVARFGGDFDVNAPLRMLTPSERTIVAIARAMSGWHYPHQLLVLDEPTAALHGREVDRLFAAVKRVAAEGAGVLFISHRLDEVFALADRVVVLRDGQVIAKRRIDELDENSLITIIAGRELASLEREAAIVGGALLSACDLAGGTVQRLDLTASAGEVVGIAGLLGSGREDAADLIFGMADRVRGHVTVGNVRLRPGPRSAISASVALVPADRAAHGLLPDLTVRENLTLPRLRPFRGRSGRLVRKTERSEVARWIDRFDVRPRQPEKAIGLLSGGNQQKVMLARWLRNDPKVLLLDEPTQGVDVGVKATIYELVRDLAKQGRAVVLLSSDAKELALVCDRILVMYDGCVVAELSGDAITEAEVLTASLGLPSTLNAETVHKENHHV